MLLKLLKLVGEELPFTFWTVEGGWYVAQRTAHAVTEHGLQVTVDRYAGLRTETVLWRDCYETEASASAALKRQVKQGSID